MKIHGEIKRGKKINVFVSGLHSFVAECRHTETGNGPPPTEPPRPTLSPRRTAAATALPREPMAGLSVVAAARSGSCPRATPPWSHRSSAAEERSQCFFVAGSAESKPNDFFFPYLRSKNNGCVHVLSKTDSPWPLLAVGRSDLGHLRIQSGHDHGLDQLLVIWANKATIWRRNLNK